MREDGFVLQSEMFQSLFTRFMTYSEDGMRGFVGEVAEVFLVVEGCVALVAHGVIVPYVEVSRATVC